VLFAKSLHLSARGLLCEEKRECNVGLSRDLGPRFCIGPDNVLKQDNTRACRATIDKATNWTVTSSIFWFPAASPNTWQQAGRCKVCRVHHFVAHRHTLSMATFTRIHLVDDFRCIHAIYIICHPETQLDTVVAASQQVM